MKRTQIYLSERELKFVKNNAQKLDISKSEMIRRIVDLHMENVEREKEKH